MKPARGPQTWLLEHCVVLERSEAFVLNYYCVQEYRGFVVELVVFVDVGGLFVVCVML